MRTCLKAPAPAGDAGIGYHEGVQSVVIWFGAPFLIGLITGLVIGRWWSLVPAPLVPVAFIPAGDDSDGAPEWQTALALLAPFALAAIAVRSSGEASARASPPDQAA